MYAYLSWIERWLAEPEAAGEDCHWQSARKSSLENWFSKAKFRARETWANPMDSNRRSRMIACTRSSAG